MNEQRYNMTIQLPQFTAKGKKAATDLASAYFTFEIDGKSEQFLPSEITPDLIRGEIKRILAIADDNTRESELFQTIFACVQLVAHAQILGSEVAVMADELAVARSQMEILEKAADVRFGPNPGGRPTS